jgi:hypothetical protein
MLTVVAAVALAGGCKKLAHEPNQDHPDLPFHDTQARRGHTPDTQARARANYANEMHDRLAKIDSRIEELNASTDPSKRELASRAEAQRNQLAQQLDKARDTTSDQWDEYKKSVDDSFSALDKELEIK